MGLQKITLNSSLLLFQKITLNSSLLLFFRRGIYPSFMFSIYSGNDTVLLPVVVGSVSQHSMHACSYTIRQAAYCITTTSKVVEYSQQGKNYQAMKKGFLKDPLCSCQSIQNVAESLSCVDNDKPDRNFMTLRQYMVETLLGCKIKNKHLHSRFANFALKFKEIELLLLSTLYWIAKTKPPESLIAAVLFIIADWDCAFANDISHLFPTAESSACSVALIHRISEWQSCIKFTFMLNKVLNSPLHEPKLSYNCTNIAAGAVKLSSQICPQLFPHGKIIILYTYFSVIVKPVVLYVYSVMTSIVAYNLKQI